MKINGAGEAAFSDHELTAMKLKDQRMNKKRSDKDDDVPEIQPTFNPTGKRFNFFVNNVIYLKLNLSKSKRI